jgi:predicted ATPase/class 3 adenylate cyclase
MTAQESLPSGTVTFLFTDIEGSTRLVQQFSERYPALLEAHRDIIRSAVGAEDGREFGAEGDAVFIAFASPAHAVAAATAAQRALAASAWREGAVIRVRMGLHSGEATLAGGNYVGLDVHRVARITAAGHGGQILLSRATAALVEANLPPGVLLRNLGEHRLKDLAHAESLYQLVVPELPSDFPALKTLDAIPNNLPIQLTSFIGRERDVAETRDLLLDGARLLTLTGPGGTGKTRLSLQLAAEVSDHFQAGAYFVPLAPVTDPSLVASTIAQSLALQESGGRPIQERLAEYVHDKELLLVLDNFEQVLTAAPLVVELLRAGPRLKIVVSSRAPLHVSGEHEYAVQPLGLPDPQHLPSLDALSQFEAVRLFIERAMAVKPDFAVTNENAPAVAEICARLDGLPLAIELAAARIKLLPPQAILARLGDRLALLSGGSRDLPARQQTLRGAIAWSHDLLGDGGRRLFARLGVFVGGARLGEAEAVSGPASELGIDVLDGLAELVDQSLVRQEEVHGEPRFTMLETIREFARERLDESGELGEIRRRHAVVYLVFLQQAEPELTGSNQGDCLDRIEHEHDNLRAAIDWTVEAAETETALRLVAAAWRFWQMRGHLHDARERIAKALVLPDASNHPNARAKALEAAGGVAYWQGDLVSARGFYEEALTLTRQLGDDAAIANAAYNLAFVAETEDTASVALASPLGQALLEESLALHRELSDRRGVAKVLWALGAASSRAGDFHAAEERYRESLAVFRDLDDRFMTGWALYELGALALKKMELASAYSLTAEALTIFDAVHDVTGIVLCLDGLAAIVEAEGNLERGMRLAGAAAALQASGGVDLAVMGRKWAGREDPAERAQSDPQLAAAWAEGQAMTTERVVAYALEDSGRGAQHSAPESPAD